MITYKLHLIRHGMIDENLQGFYIGKTNVPLSKIGIENLNKLKTDLNYPNIEKIYTSPLLRCLQTVDILYPNTLTETIDDMKEYDFGDFENKNFAELKKNSNFMNWIEGKKDVYPPNGEKSEDFSIRIEKGINYILNDMMKNKISSAALITHGAIIMNILSHFGYPKNEPHEWICQHGQGYTIMVTPQFWMRDKIFEIYSKIPFKLLDNISLSEMEDDYDWKKDV